MNPPQTEVLYGKTVEYACLTGKETIIDAYCGNRHFTVPDGACRKGLWGESAPEAIEDVRRSTELNGMSNVTF